MITYQLETWEDFVRDGRYLWTLHWEEVGYRKDKKPLAMDMASYVAAQQAGILQLTTARCAGKLVGYVIAFVKRHLHYAHLCGFEDVYYLAKEHRRGMTGVKLIGHAIQAMKDAGAQEIIFMSKIAHNKGRIFEYLGFQNTDTVYSKWIGD